MLPVGGLLLLAITVLLKYSTKRNVQLGCFSNVPSGGHPAELRGPASVHTVSHSFTPLPTPSSHFPTPSHVASAQAAQQRLREACTALDGAEGRGRWKAVQSHLVARRDRLVSELAVMFEVRCAAHNATTEGREGGDALTRGRGSGWHHARVAGCLYAVHL